MAVCEFLHCTFTEMKSRVQNPADYALILGYVIEKNKREELASERAKAKAEFEHKVRNKRGAYGTGRRRIPPRRR